MKKYTSLLSALSLFGVVVLIYLTMMPKWHSADSHAMSKFSTKRALKKVEIIAQKPHFVGTQNHEIVASYIIRELQRLGLETTIQEGYTLSDWGNLVKSKNILARIKGTNSSKALLLLSHYDSAPHSFSKGASDDASGVATILEGVRAFLYSKKKHNNDIIILFTDAEELGLNGAALFVSEHPWAKEVGLVINFEARGSSGPSYMLMETNKGNAGLVKEFAKAEVTYPVSNSLMYSIYKMLPNDTDLTVFREQGNIQGFNFAFIDDHYNYHTAQDDVQHLSKKSLAHQGAYLVPLLNYFSNTNLDSTVSNDDYVYFTIPFTFISYPFAWVLPMTLIALGLFLLLLFLGKAKRVITLTEITKGLIPFFCALITAGLITFFGWKGLLLAYPQYNDLINGFTYNGHAYIAGFVLLSISICFLFYHIFSGKKVAMNHYVIPILIWIIINGFLANRLPGAGFLIIPVYFGLLTFAVYIYTQKAIWIINLLFAIPAILLIAPFIHMFPIGLGLKVLFGSAILTVLTFGLLLPVFGAFTKKRSWSVWFLLFAIGFFVKAHITSNYEVGKAKSNSLVYLYNADTNKAHWVTYDTNLDSWTKKYLGEHPKSANTLNTFELFSKYNSKFTFTTVAPLKDIKKPTIEFLQDSIVENKRSLKIKITPNRSVNRYDIFANETMAMYNFTANGVSNFSQKGTEYERKGKKILSYYVVNNEPLELQFSINKITVLEMDLMESSFNLMTNPLFMMAKREDWMMPTPFILNDAVILQEKIKPTPKAVNVAPRKIIKRRATKSSAPPEAILITN